MKKAHQQTAKFTLSGFCLQDVGKGREQERKLCRDLLAQFEQTTCKPMSSIGNWLFVQTASKISPAKSRLISRERIRALREAAMTRRAEGRMPIVIEVRNGG